MSWIDKRRRERGQPVLPQPSRTWDDDGVHGLTKDVAFNRHSMNDGEHVSPSDNGQLQVGTDNIRVALIQGINEEAFKKTLSAAVRATVGLDMTQTLPGDWEDCQDWSVWVKSQPDRDNAIHDLAEGFNDWTSCSHTEHRYQRYQRQGLDEPRYQGQKPMQDWEEMLKGGLQTALETQTIVFAVGGVSRTATHQLVRSRRASFHQQSQRASYMGDCPEVRCPESIWVNRDARHEFFRSVMASWRSYKNICDMDISYQDARFVLPEGTTNFIMLEYPVLEFLNVYAYRGCSMFQWEIVHVMRECRRALVEAHPWIEPYVKISCEKTGPVDIPLGQFTEGQGRTERVEHHCTFQGWEDVEGQCDFSWAKHEARTFKPEFHRISRQKS